MDSSIQIHFFMGKGGVGKSTLSALHALQFAKSQRTLLVSMDPAHNLSDIFEEHFNERSRPLNDNLSVMEIDIDSWIKKYLKNIQDKISDSYRYLSAINLDKKFEILKYSPGLEEYALLLAFETIIKEHSAYGHLIFDMPPTALALRFFALPKLSLVWVENLLKLRQEIIEKRDIITKIKIGKKSYEGDKILNKLNELKENYGRLNLLFKENGVVDINIVMNDDRLSLKETQRIYDNLNDLGIGVSSICLNKIKEQEKKLADYKKLFPAIPFKIYKQADFPLIGLSSLNKYLVE